jgi:hypothetical protein
VKCEGGWSVTWVELELRRCDADGGAALLCRSCGHTPKARELLESGVSNRTHEMQQTRHRPCWQPQPLSPRAPAPLPEAVFTGY